MNNIIFQKLVLRLLVLIYKNTAAIGLDPNNSLLEEVDHFLNKPVVDESKTARLYQVFKVGVVLSNGNEHYDEYLNFGAKDKAALIKMVKQLRFFNRVFELKRLPYVWSEVEGKLKSRVKL